MKFELLSSRHSNSRGNFVKGDIVESPFDLTVTFANKFKRRLDLEQGAPVSAPVSTPKKGVIASDSPAQPASQPTETPAQPVESPLGADVTAEFADAVDADFKVFKDAKGKFFVTESDDVNTALNAKPLNKGGVVSLIQRYIANPSAQ